jgi:hypothetical protein
LTAFFQEGFARSEIDRSSRLQIIFDKLYRDEPLGKFRTAKTPFVKNKRKAPSREGLDSLKVSASSQPSEGEIQFIISQIDPGYKITFIDLREENHAYINGEPILWHGLSQDHFLLYVKNQDYVHVSDKNGKHRVKIEAVCFEQDLALKYGMGYVRFPCFNAKEPSPEIVDAFIEYIENMDPSAWVHLHCRQGWSRTTTFFIMIDMLHNADKVSKEDIFLRHNLIGGAYISLNNVLKEQHKFLLKFYMYAKLRKQGQAGSWSQFRVNLAGRDV